MNKIHMNLHYELFFKETVSKESSLSFSIFQWMLFTMNEPIIMKAFTLTFTLPLWY